MSSRTVRPSGVATLELVMCMPIILALMVALIWLGFSVIGQAEVAIEARHKAWKQRFDEGEGKPLNFLADDFVTEKATGKVEISPLTDDISPPESSHVIGKGTWDHSHLEMNQAPNWEHYLTAAVNAKTGGLQAAYTDARNELTKLQQIAAQAVIEEITNTIKEFLENPLADLTGAGDQAKRENENKARQEKARIQREIRETKEEIAKVKKHIKDLEKNEEDAKVRIEVQKNKLKRLDSELELLREDLKALD